MMIIETSRRGLVTLSKLTTVTIMFLSLATTTSVIAANTSPSTTRAEILSAAKLDKMIGVLSNSDAILYRSIFEAQKANDWEKADNAISSLTDKRLMGNVLSDRYKRRPSTAEEMAIWLKDYSDLPDANDIFTRANQLSLTSPLQIESPTSPEPWSGGSEIDSAADFSYGLSSMQPAGTENRLLARKIDQALRKGSPEKARDLLIAAQVNQPLTGTFAADAEATIAAGFFYAGERKQSKSLATASAAANQPLGLWIKGLIAWEQNDMLSASSSFSKLAEHPAPSIAGRAAAQFWAYRSFNRIGNTKKSIALLEKAAKQTRSFYGLLAAQLLNHSPVAAASQSKSLPVWGAEKRSVIADTSAGWRALALIQIGEVTLAESELRRLNPQGKAELQQAMLALASIVPMPALVLQLASLSSPVKENNYNAAHYPLPPWQPQQGFKIDRALLFAMARHESLFDPSAVSSKGALGLMQLMPSTAEIMAISTDGDLGLSDDSKLFDPEYNLSLGQKYVQHLVSRPKIGNNLMLLLAAYNGGPSKLSRWMDSEVKFADKNGELNDPLLFMESIPQRETRNYIARVLPHYWAYCARLSEPLTSLRQLAEGKWPQIASTSEKSKNILASSRSIRLASNLASLDMP